MGGIELFGAVALRISFKEKEENVGNSLISLKATKEALKDYFDFSLYDEYLKDDGVMFKLKDDVFRNNINDFLIEQAYNIYSGETLSIFLQNCSKVKELNLDELEQIHLKNIYFNCTKLNHLIPDSKYELLMQGITFFDDDIVSYHNLQKTIFYLSKLLRQSSKNILKNTTYFCLK